MAVKVLVVEDDSFLISAYQAKFIKEGLEIEIASDGEEAISKLHNFKPDVILMDVVMPRKDGFTTLQEIKANPDWKSIPVIMASNLGQPSDIEKAKSLGAHDFVTKSNTPIAELVNIVKSFGH